MSNGFCFIDAFCFLESSAIESETAGTGQVLLKEVRHFAASFKVAAGKHELSVLNAIKSKMLLRVAAVVNSGKPYVDKLAKAA